MDELSSVQVAFAAIDEVLNHVGTNDLGRRTPCRDFTVGELAGHLVDTIARLGRAAGITAAASADGTVKQRVDTVTTAVLAGWRRRGIDGSVNFAGRTLPDRVALGILSLELVVHGWDFAMAMDLRLPITEAHAVHVLAQAQQTLTPRSRTSAGFDPPVPVSADAPALDRLVAFTGRNPDLEESGYDQS